MIENIESIETSGPRESVVYSPERIQQRVDAIHRAEIAAEPWKSPGYDLQPNDPMIISKFGYKSRSEVPAGQ